jgi:hypothetical protein
MRWYRSLGGSLDSLVLHDCQIAATNLSTSGPLYNITRHELASVYKRLGLLSRSIVGNLQLETPIDKAPDRIHSWQMEILTGNGGERDAGSITYPTPNLGELSWNSGFSAKPNSSFEQVKFTATCTSVQLYGAVTHRVAYPTLFASFIDPIKIQ